MIFDTLLPKGQREIEICEHYNNEINVFRKGFWRQKFPLYISDTKMRQELTKMNTDDFLKICLAKSVQLEMMHLNEVNEILDKFRTHYYSVIKTVNGLVNNHKLTRNLNGQITLPIRRFIKTLNEDDADVIYGELTLTESSDDNFFEVEQIIFPMKGNQNIRFYERFKENLELPYYLIDENGDDLTKRFSINKNFQNENRLLNRGKKLLITKQIYQPADRVLLSKDFTITFDAFQKQGFDIFTPPSTIQVTPFKFYERKMDTINDERFYKYNVFVPINIIRELYLQLNFRPKSFAEVLVLKNSKCKNR